MNAFFASDAGSLKIFDKSQTPKKSIFFPGRKIQEIEFFIKKSRFSELSNFQITFIDSDSKAKVMQNAFGFRSIRGF